MALIEVRLRPAGPWRVGHRAGDRDRVDVVYHSDALYSGITHAMRALGWLEEWLDATARAAGDPAVRFSSLFPFIGRTRLIAPPAASWPPANPGKFYLRGTKLVPLEVVQTGVLDESKWTVDGSCQCIVPSGAGAPFHVSLRSAAAVDRLTGAPEPHRTACLEFATNAGWWGVFDVADKAWEARVKSAFRLLADSGFGGERSRGWGRAGAPEFSSAGSLFPAAPNGSWWLLSLYSPHENDAVDWSKGEYSATTRGGWTDSPAGAGAKKMVRMIEEGSVVMGSFLRGRAVDVAPEGFAHPVYRAGFALAVPLPAPAVPARELTSTAARVLGPEPQTDVPAPSRDGEEAEAKPTAVPEPVLPEPEPATAPEAESTTVAEPEKQADVAAPSRDPEETEATPIAEPEPVLPEPEPAPLPEAESTTVTEPEPQAVPAPGRDREEAEATPTTEPEPVLPEPELAPEVPAEPEAPPVPPKPQQPGEVEG